MNLAFSRFSFLSYLALCTALGCSSGSNGAKDGGDASKASTGGAPSAGSGTGSSGSGGAGTGGSSGTGGGAGPKLPTPPPESPRDLGPADGTYCQTASNTIPITTCPVGMRCCPNASAANPDYPICSPGGEKCAPCRDSDCAQLRCDGPEDCAGGQFCCYDAEGLCELSPDCVPAPGAETASWSTVECRARCSQDPNDRESGAVVCKDDHDCPGKYAAGRCRPLPVGEVLPNGIKICFGSGK
jgi:hypothetical protein